MNLIAKIWSFRWVLRSLPQTLWFNFHYLPFRQASRLPILLYKPHLYRTKGSIRIEGKVRPGMIVMGKMTAGIYPNDGFIYENHGGCITFQGNFALGNHSSISVDRNGRLTLGRNVQCNVVKIIASTSVNVGSDSRIGWDTVVTDSDFHSIVADDNQGLLSVCNPPSSIVIGNHCWIAMRCTVLKGTILPAHSVAAAGTILNKNYGTDGHLLLAGVPARVVKKGIEWSDDKPDLI